ncbi:hypothetical protein RB601_004603 [Gaeumannomyces tritici]
MALDSSQEPPKDDNLGELLKEPPEDDDQEELLKEPPKDDKLGELLKELKEVYDREVREYQRCLKIVAQDLGHVLAQEAIRHLPIAARVKSWDSISGTAQRRQKDRLAALEIRNKMREQKEKWRRHFRLYRMSEEDVGHFGSREELARAFHDMLGARIVLYFPSDKKKTVELLEGAGYVNAKDAKKMGGLADPKRLRKLHERWSDKLAAGARPADDLDLDDSEKQFSGYGALHLTVKVPERLRPRDLAPQAEAIWAERVVEIQAGTVIMHAWAEIEHDITYKTHGRQVSQDEKGMLDMLNGLALASEVGMRRFQSPPVSESPATESEEEVRGWLHQLYIKNRCSTPNEWVDVDLLRDFLVKNNQNRRNEFLPLAERAWSMLGGHEGRIGLQLDHFLPHVIMDGGQVSDATIKKACRRVGLLQAAYDGQEAVVRLLLEKEVNKDSKGVDEESKGVDEQSKGVDKESKEVDKESKDCDGDTPLSLAAIRGHEAVVRLLLENGADREARNRNGSTPLLWAAARGHEAVVKLLLRNGANWEAKDNCGSTALSWAVRQGHEAVELLLRDKAAAEHTPTDDDLNPTPPSSAAKDEPDSGAGLLPDKGTRIKPAGADSMRPPSPAAAVGGSLIGSSGPSRLSAEKRQAVVRLVLEKGADTESAGRSEKTPLLLAAEEGDEAAVERLLNEGDIDVDSKNQYGSTPLSRAAGNGHEGVVKLLLDAGNADVESKNRHGFTPLARAAYNGHEAVVKLLLDTGKVDVDSKNQEGGTPLSWAAEQGHEAVVKLLLETGKADVNPKNKYGFTPLSRASADGHDAVVQLLINEDKIDVDLKGPDGGTPLSWAAEMGHETIVELLLNTGKVDVDSKNRYGFTPLSRAAGNGHETVVKRLLGTGKVDVDSKSQHGETPLSRATEKGHEAVIKMLCDKKAKN